MLHLHSLNRSLANSRDDVPSVDTRPFCWPVGSHRHDHDVTVESPEQLCGGMGVNSALTRRITTSVGDKVAEATVCMCEHE